jgi:hypothetical protein
MKKHTRIGLGAAAVVFCSALFLGYQKWGPSSGAARTGLLQLVPQDAGAVLFVDLEELRRAPFIAELYAWAPKPQVDPDYAQFVKETGFNYERDLDRIAIAVQKRGNDSTHFAVAEGKFDRAKICAYALRTGMLAKNSGHEIFSVPVSGNAKKVSFTFLKDDRIALTDDVDLGVLLSIKGKNTDAAEWRTRFERLAGSPVFAVIRQDAAAGAALAAQAPGGLRSPQLSMLLDQLQWITLAGKPENDRLRVVAEGECASEATVRQLSDLLNGVLVLAQAGLNGAKTRAQLAPAVREAYLELLKNADVSKIDRGDSKSVRLVFELTPKFLEASRAAAPAPPDSDPGKPNPGKPSATKKGHT